MTNKFTEEQYHEIIKAWESQVFYEERTQAVVEFMSFSETKNPIIVEALALANPSTREWAHKQFVEKEKKFYWTNKKNDKYGVTWYLTREIAVVMMGDHRQYNGDEQLTESEIREWGYNPEMFDKEEVRD